MKSYTNIEESKRLAEILQPESADMCWGISDETLKWKTFPYLMPWRDYTAKEHYLPCWSLAALLEAIREKAGCDLSIWEKGYNIDVYDLETGKAIAELYSNPVDAAVETIYKLKENNLL